MQSFPMFIKTSGRHFVVAGGGEQAAQKCRLLLKTDVAIRLLADHLDDELASLVAKGRVTQVRGPINAESFAGATMAFIATGSPAADNCIHALAKEAGTLVNVVDRPDLCDVTTPSIVDRSPVVIAIGTEGTAPVLARRLKARFEQMLDPSLGRFAEAAGNLRGMVARHVPAKERRAFWREVFTGSVWRSFKTGAERQALAELKDRIRNGTPVAVSGQITIVDTSAGAADLVSLRAVERLQEADEIFYESPSDQDVLELARRDAERHLLGGAGGGKPWPERMSVSFVKRAASNGNCVVWLKNCANSDVEKFLKDLDGQDNVSVEFLGAPSAKATEKQAFCA